MTSGRGAMVVVGGLAGLLLVISLFSGWQGASRLRGQGQDMSAVEDAAREFVEAYGTFDFREPDAYRTRLMQLSTGTVHEAVSTSQVDPASIGQQQTIATDSVAVDVTALSDDAATASATVEQTRRATDPATGQLREQRVRQHVACRLVLVNGRWLVAEFRLTSQEPIESNGK